MPVEIKELYIKVTVNEPSPQAHQSSPEAANGKDKEGKEGIITQCIEEVLTIIKDKKER